MKKLMTLLLIAMVATPVYAQEPAAEVKVGTIKGQVIDKETKTPLIRTNIIVVGTQRGRLLI